MVSREFDWSFIWSRNLQFLLNRRKLKTAQSIENCLSGHQLKYHIGGVNITRDLDCVYARTILNPLNSFTTALYIATIYRFDTTTLYIDTIQRHYIYLLYSHTIYSFYTTTLHIASIKSTIYSYCSTTVIQPLKKIYHCNNNRDNQIFVGKKFLAKLKGW